MPFERPTLDELISRGKTNYDSKLEGADTRLIDGTLSILNKDHAGAIHGNYGALKTIEKQVFIQTAQTEELEKHASQRGVERKPATKATGTVEATGNNGSIIPAGAVLTRSDNERFLVDSEETIAGGTATLALTAETAGSSGNTEEGSALGFVSPIGGVNSEVTVNAGGIADGNPEETDDELRARLLALVQNIPMAGAVNDYERWALEIEGVTRVWVVPQYWGAGTVGVSFMKDNKTGGNHLGLNTILNGDFGVADPWILGTGWSIGAGVASCDGIQTGNSDLSQEDRVRAGAEYEVTFTLSNYSAGSVTPYLGSTNGAAASANGVHTETIKAGGSGNVDFNLQANSTFVGDIDDVSAKIINPAIIPNTSEVQEVQDYLDLKRPVTAIVLVYPLKPISQAFDISLSPNNPEVQAQVELELQDLLDREGVPAGTLHLSQISEAISAAPGEISHILNSPTSLINVANDEILTLGTVTF